jgi:hypothetical protein
MILRMARTFPAGLALLLGAVATASSTLAAPPPPDEAEQELFVTGERLPIIVTAPPRCRPLAGDRLDAVDVSTAFGRQQVLKADESGRIGVHHDDDPITGPETWQRAGTAIRNYVFRAPMDGTPLCIGARSRNPDGFAQLRRVQDPGGAHGSYVRFTAFVATRSAAEVRLWLAAGDERNVWRGGDTRHAPLGGTSGWTPVMLTMGPIPERATKISYGFLLWGAGDVWLTEPRLEFLDERPRGMRDGGLLVAIGRPERAP